MNKFTPEQIDDIKKAKSKIAASIRAKLLDPLITNEVHDLLLHNSVLSGGAIASIILNEKVNDFDLYFKSDVPMNTFTKIMSYKHNQAMIKEATTSYGTGKLVTACATTLLNDIQVITMQLSSDRNKSFDFVHCLPYYDLNEDKLYISPKEYQCIVTKKLVVNNPESLTDRRINKYKERGWQL